MSAVNPFKEVSIKGRLSFPTWTAAEAFERNQRGMYPAKDIATVSPDFQLVLTQVQWDKFLNHATQVFLPYCAEQFAKDKKENDALEPSEVKALIDVVTGDLNKQLYNTPAKPVTDKTLALVPDAVAVVKCIGPKGGNIALFAKVEDASELDPMDPDIIDFPKVLPINVTKHQMYAGAYVAATLSLYSYRNGKHPGFSAKATAAVFWENADQFGGSVGIDLDQIFMD
jgi:hypothetical protein